MLVKNKLIIIQLEMEDYICYEFDNETYSMTTLNTIKMIKKVSDNLDRYYIYFSCISRAELAYIVSKVREYYKFNKLDINILNNSVFTIVDQKKLIKDIITNRKFVKKFDNSKKNNIINNNGKKKIKKLMKSFQNL